ncbi:MauE/DoxX family redox-associated membrane protein, partial [Nonomuraea wenchangensis]|uniref:MauE/DoxX family redox-associated membrane protein n=1 Tax=Nonomuraea wenchangensis TaxID=568860 RepID=UPI0034360CF2
MTYLAIGCAWLVSVVFAASAVSKVRGRAAYGEFAEAVRTLVPALRGRRALATATTQAVVVAEAAAAVLAAVPATARAGSALAVVLLTAFSIAIASALRRRA